MNPDAGYTSETEPLRKAEDEPPIEASRDAKQKALPAKGNDVSYLDRARQHTKLVEFDGYHRVRMDFMHKMNLDQGYNSAGPGPAALPPFPSLNGCVSASGQADYLSCRDQSLGDANMRLRIEPTVNLSDQIRVRGQFDVFDNLILGSTPDSLVRTGSVAYDSTGQGTNAPMTADVLSNTQIGYGGSILAKRAWAEFDTELGSLRFGRMPWHFGRGMYFNHGACADCEGGTTVDRLMAVTAVYGHQLAVSVDFGAQGYNLGYIDLGQKNIDGFPLDLTQKDDVSQYTAVLTKIENDQTWRKHVTAGELALNYGAQFVYRSQGYATYGISPGDGTPYSINNQSPLSASDLGNSLTTNVNARLLVPSFWFRLGWRALTLEVEGTVLAGRIENAGPLRFGTTLNDQDLTILEAGWVAASELKLLDDSLFVGFETGGATGDQAELAYRVDPNTNETVPYYPYLNYRWKFVPQPVGDRNLNDFHFSPEYHVDEILYRRILGTVTNAIYVKPRIDYWLDLDHTRLRRIGASAAMIYSIAPVPVSTPGNSRSLGLEMDLGIHYRNLGEAVYAGIVWGVLWPMAALSRPDPLWTHAEGANCAQVLRGFVGIRF